MKTVTRVITYSGDEEDISVQLSRSVSYGKKCGYGKSTLTVLPIVPEESKWSAGEFYDHDNSGMLIVSIYHKLGKERFEKIQIRGTDKEELEKLRDLILRTLQVHEAIL